MKKTDIAWAAGIVDGEGCITITTCPASSTQRCVIDRFTMCLRVQMCHRPTIQRLIDLFGAGTVHSNVKKSARKNQSFCWVLQSHMAARVIKIIRPYLVTKAAEADVALEFAALPLAPRGGAHGSNRTPASLITERRRLYWQIRKLKPTWRFRHLRKKRKNARKK